MSWTQVFTNTKMLIDSLGLPGDEPGLLRRVREASSYLHGVMGEFVPVTETRTFESRFDSGELPIGTLLALTSITDLDGNTISTDDYELRPRNRTRPNGPYTRIDGPLEASITGRWGRYEGWLTSGLTGTLATTAVTSLSVSNGGLLWPGMIIKLDDEQCLVTAANGGENSPTPTAAVSVVTSNAADDDDVIAVTNGAEFLAGEVIRIGYEDMIIRRIVGHDLVVSRGWNGTRRAAHLANAAISVYRTVTIERAANGTTAATHAAAALTIAEIPEDVMYLATQIAALMRGKAQTGFTGRAGNAESGESFWLNEFPRGQIDAVRWKYADEVM